MIFILCFVNCKENLPVRNEPASIEAKIDIEKSWITATAQGEFTDEELTFTVGIRNIFHKTLEGKQKKRVTLEFWAKDRPYLKKTLVYEGVNEEKKLVVIDPGETS